jgi:hypothetical protein
MGSMWALDGFMKEDYKRILYMAFDKFGVWNWSGNLFLGKVCGVIVEKRE